MPSHKQHATSVRLDDYQLSELTRLAKFEQRSFSYLIRKAVDLYIAENQGTTRDEYERNVRSEAARRLVESFQPKEWTVPVDDPRDLFEAAAQEAAQDPERSLDARIQELLENHDTPASGSTEAKRTA